MSLSIPCILSISLVSRELLRILFICTPITEEEEEEEEEEID